MQLQLLKTIVVSVAGPGASGIVDLLYGKKNVNEFLIAKKLRLSINQTRNMLYKLADDGLVSFVRKKDAKKGGWYTYYWTLNSGKGLVKFRERVGKSLEQLQQYVMQRKHERFFFCVNCEMEFTEEQALMQQYTCPECGQVLQLKDTSAEILQKEKEIARLQNVLASVHTEIEAMSTAEEKARQRRMKAEARRKQVERVLQAKARRRMKMKVEAAAQKAKEGKGEVKKSMRKNGKSVKPKAKKTKRAGKSTFKSKQWGRKRIHPK